MGTPAYTFLGLESIRSWPQKRIKTLNRDITLSPGSSPCNSDSNGLHAH